MAALVAMIALTAPAGCGGDKRSKARTTSPAVTAPADPLQIIPPASQLVIDYFHLRAEGKYAEATDLATLPLAAQTSYRDYIRFVDPNQSPPPATADVVPAFFDAHDKGGGVYALDGTVTVQLSDGSAPTHFDRFVVAIDKEGLKLADFADDEGPLAHRSLSYRSARKSDTRPGVSAELEAAVASFASGRESVGYVVRIFDKTGVDKRFVEGQPFSMVLTDGASLGPDYFAYKPEDDKGSTVDVVIEFHGDKAPRAAKGGTFQAATVLADGRPGVTVKLDLPAFPS